MFLSTYYNLPAAVRADGDVVDVVVPRCETFAVSKRQDTYKKDLLDHTWQDVQYTPRDNFVGTWNVPDTMLGHDLTHTH